MSRTADPTPGRPDRSPAHKRAVVPAPIRVVGAGGPPPLQPPAANLISAAGLRDDLVLLAGHAMRGREAGSLDELRAAAWVAERARAEGLLPAGEDGTYFQFFPMRRLRQSEDSRIALSGEPLALGRDAVTFGPVRASLRAAPLLWLPPGEPACADAVRGRVVATIAGPPSELDPPGISLERLRYAVRAVAERSQELLRLGAGAVVVASDAAVEAGFDDAGAAVLRGRYAADAGPATFRPDPAPVIWVRRRFAADLQRPGACLDAELQVDSFVHPSVNVVAVAPGIDPDLGGEYVLFSGHVDHDGVRPREDGAESLRPGADDNGSMCVALLAIARAWRRRLARRSALFVWHGAEERGLLGSHWLAAHPPVPLGAVVAVLNGDMIGRNAGDRAVLLGAEPPNRNSSALVEAALVANDQVAGFVLEAGWDAPDHPEAFYLRSDHLPYARAAVPAVFFTSALHRDYHAESDTAERIDYDKLARMARWIYATGWRVANLPERPALDAE